MLNDPFAGIFFSVGEVTKLTQDGVERLVIEKVYKIEPVGESQYLININNVNTNFKVRTLGVKVNNQITDFDFSLDNIGMDTFTYENGNLVHTFIAKYKEEIRTGRFILKKNNC